MRISDIARSFAQGKAIEKRVTSTVQAFAWLGHLATSDRGETFVLRRGA